MKVIVDVALQLVFLIGRKLPPVQQIDCVFAQRASWLKFKKYYIISVMLLLQGMLIYKHSVKLELYEIYCERFQTN